MTNSALVPEVSAQPPLPTSQLVPSSQICIPSAPGNFPCIYTHELISLILAIAVLIKAVRRM
jgi:hypothetical protein